MSYSLVSRGWTRHFERSTSGQTYEVIEPPMPRIHDDFKDCVVYLYPSLEDARDGEKVGGTGFLVFVPLPSNEALGCIFVVTNEHVYTQAPVVRINRRDGTIAIAALTEAHWIPHPDGDDVAVAPIQVNKDQHQIMSIPLQMLISKEEIVAHDIGPGDDVFLVGRFVNHEGRVQNTPTLRFGNIAQMPAPIYQTERDFEQESFLVEAKSISGYSGSPVFVHMLPMTARPSKAEPSKLVIVPFPGAGPWLLGVDWGHLHREAWLHDFDGGSSKPPKFVWENTGMMGVVPAWKIRDLINHPRTQETVKRADEKYQRDKRKAAGAMDVATKVTAEDEPAADVDARVESTLRVMLATPPSPKVSATRTRAKRAKKI